MAIKIVPSIISSDLSDLDGEVKKIEEAEADEIHVDVYPMILWILEYHALSKYTIGTFLIESLKKRTSIPLDLHLMVEVDQEVIKRYLDSGCSQITIPVEASYKPKEILKLIKDNRMEAGVSITPLTPIELIYPYLGDVDSVLFLTNNANYGGKIHYDDVVARIRDFKSFSDNKGYTFDIGIDGGVDLENVPKMIEAGVNKLVIGHSFFKENSKKLVGKIRELGKDQVRKG